MTTTKTKAHRKHHHGQHQVQTHQRNLVSMTSTVFGYWCHCGRKIPEGSLYCSHKCRNQDVPTASAHANHNAQYHQYHHNAQLQNTQFHNYIHHAIPYPHTLDYTESSEPFTSDEEEDSELELEDEYGDAEMFPMPQMNRMTWKKSHNKHPRSHYTTYAQKHTHSPSAMTNTMDQLVRYFGVVPSSHEEEVEIHKCDFSRANDPVGHSHHHNHHHHHHTHHNNHNQQPTQNKVQCGFADWFNKIETFYGKHDTPRGVMV